MATPWNTPCGKLWFGPCCTMVHAAETSSHLLHTTGCMRPTAYVPWSTPRGMNVVAIVAFFPWFTIYLRTNMTRQLMAFSTACPMGGPWRIFRKKHSTVRSRPWTTDWLPYGQTTTYAMHASWDISMPGSVEFPRFGGIPRGSPWDMPRIHGTPWYIYGLICRGVYN